jgi:hypothetical protein
MVVDRRWLSEMVAGMVRGLKMVIYGRGFGSEKKMKAVMGWLWWAFLGPITGCVEKDLCEETQAAVVVDLRGEEDDGLSGEGWKGGGRLPHELIRD